LSAAWRSEQDTLQRKIQDIRKATPGPLDEAINIIKLTSEASKMFTQPSAAEQRRLLAVVIKQAASKTGSCGQSCSNRLKYCATRTWKA